MPYFKALNEVLKKDGPSRPALLIDLDTLDKKIDALRRFKDDVREVASGYECGITLDGMNDIKVGDVIEAFTIEELARTL